MVRQPGEPLERERTQQLDKVYPVHGEDALWATSATPSLDCIRRSRDRRGKGKKKPLTKLFD